MQENIGFQKHLAERMESEAFSNGSRDGGSFVSDIDACRVSAFSTCSCGT
jgi:hypothetical protein